MSRNPTSSLDLQYNLLSMMYKLSQLGGKTPEFFLENLLEVHLLFVFFTDTGPGAGARNTCCKIHTNVPADPVSKQDSGQKKPTLRTYLYSLAVNIAIQSSQVVVLVLLLCNRNYRSLAIWSVTLINKLRRHLQVAAAFVI